ncbi:HIT family protein [Actinomadura nitritigenes]|uniref:HIT family protein n=1 Tax=Actinomadura nitritigenes TaxID=134602 RepID=UPI003D8D24D6
MNEVASDDTACLFCDRDASVVIGESASWWIRLDNFPANPGHVQLVTKRHVESIFDLYGDEEAELHGVRLYARDLIVARLGHTPDGWTIGVNEGRAAGRSIDHIHEHLIPRYHWDVPDPRGGIRRAAPNCNPDMWIASTGEVASPASRAPGAPDELLLIALSAFTGKKLASLYDLIGVEVDDHEAIERVLRAVLPAAYRQWFAQAFGTPEEIAARAAAAAGRAPDETVRLCETARPGEHEQRIRARLADELERAAGRECGNDRIDGARWAAGWLRGEE